MLNKQTYLLICLIEECAEIIQCVCKAIRFGLDEIQPGQGYHNLDRISFEVNDFIGVATMLDEECKLEILNNDELAIRRKIDKVHSFMPLSRERGMLEQEQNER